VQEQTLTSTSQPPQQSSQTILPSISQVYPKLPSEENPSQKLSHRLKLAA